MDDAPTISEDSRGAGIDQASSSGKSRLENGSSTTFRRRRGRRACITCHERKVRCDVLQRQPCTNCAQDRCRCIVRPHKNRRAAVEAMELAKQSGDSDLRFKGDENHPNLELEPMVSAVSTSTDLQSLRDPKRPCAIYGRSTMFSNGRQSSPSFIYDEPTGRPTESTWIENSTSAISPQPHLDTQDQWGSFLNFDALFESDTRALTGLESVFNSTPAVSSAQQHQVLNLPSPRPSLSVSDVAQSPTNLDFLDLSKSPLVNQYLREYEATNPDHDYLRSQGCFQVPATPLFYLLMHSYFSFVHPNVPVVNEAEFWTLWSADGSTFNIGGFSVLVLQAMAFAATSFASTELCEQFGLGNARKARTVFYRRAKLLFDMEVEQDPINMSRAALLLTYFATSANKLRVNSMWLTHAIRFAQIANAHRFHEVASTDHKRHMMLKRLWWCCMIRDRILPLGLRRPIQIRDTLPIIGDDKFLSEDDFADELGFSRVHDAAAQRRIFQVINCSCRFAEVLTPAMVMLFTAEKPRERAISTPDTLLTSLRDVKHYIDQCHAWHDFALRMFPPPIALDEEPVAIVVYGNLLFIYYNAAILALCHHAFLLWETRDPRSNNDQFDAPVNEIFHAVSNTTERTKELVHLRLAQHLPISVSAYLCLPLLLSAVSVKAASTEAGAAVARRVLDIYTKVMKQQQALYDGTDYVFEIIDNITTYADQERVGLVLDQGEDGTIKSGTMTPMSANATALAAPLQQPFAWRILLQRRPRLYLRLILHLDVAFCDGTPPQEEDFPVELRRT